jgi:hypothetical protein
LRAPKDFLREPLDSVSADEHNASLMFRTREGRSALNFDPLDASWLPVADLTRG